MSRMGMLKTISGRFGHVVGEHDSDTDDGAKKPETPKINRKDKRAKKALEGGVGPAPAIYQKPEKKDLKEGHNPNKPAGVGVSTRQIIVQPSMRHMNYQASMRNIASIIQEELDPAEPSPTRDLGASQPSSRKLDKKSSMRNMGMNGLDKKSSMRNLAMNGMNKKSSMRNIGMNGIDKKSSMDKKKSVRNMNNGTRPLTSINEASTRLSDTIDEKGIVSKINSIEETTSLGAIVEDEDNPTRIISSTIDEKTSMRSLDENSKHAMNAVKKKNDMRNLNSVKSMRLVNIEEERSEEMYIDEKDDPIDEKGSIDTNQNNISANKLNGSNNSKSSNTSTKSAASTSTKSTASISNKSSTSMNGLASTSTTRSTSLSNNSVIDEIDIRNTIKSGNKSKSYQSSNNNISSSVHSNGTSKSCQTKNSGLDNRSVKSRDRKQLQPRKNIQQTSIGVPHQFDRDRPSTALITRKELEEILNAKMKEEMIESKTLPPTHGTLSTDLWVDAVNMDDKDDRSSHCSDLEESPRSQNKGKLDIDEYDIKFTDFSDGEEVTVHSDHMDSFNSGDFNLADSMDRGRFTTIRFDEYDELQTCLHINDYTKHEIMRSWYKRHDYDKMVDLARKTASKAVKREKELREEVASMVRASQIPPKRRVTSKGGNDHEDPANRGDDDNKSIRSNRSTGTADGKRKKPIEYRGLEAWTPVGSAKCRTLKEAAIEEVWNEQSRQWEDGTFDPDAISAVYIPVSAQALVAARDRAMADEKMVRKLIEQERARAEKKRNRNVLNKSKSALKKTAKVTRKGIVQGGSNVLKQTGKVGFTIGKRSNRLAVGVMTADPRMVKEAVTQKKKRECKHQTVITTSQAAHERDVEELEESGSIPSLPDTNAHFFANGRPGLQRPGLQKPALGVSSSDKASDNGSDRMSDGRDYSNRSFGESDSRTESIMSTSSNKKKKSKLKLLGVVPIPGTQKMYSEDRREQRAKERTSKMTRRPSWEASSMAGKH